MSPLVSAVTVAGWLNKPEKGRFPVCSTSQSPSQLAPVETLALPKRYYRLLRHISEYGPRNGLLSTSQVDTHVSCVAYVALFAKICIYVCL